MRLIIKKLTHFPKIYISDAVKLWLVGDSGGTDISIAFLTLTLLLEISSIKILVAGILVIVTDIIKPRLTVSEVFHRLAPSEGQKEIARRSIR